MGTRGTSQDRFAGDWRRMSGGDTWGEVLHGPGGGHPVRIYADAALAVEERWNELGRSRRFLSLLCGYRLDVFDRGVQAGLLVDICRTHTHVLPAADPARLERAVDAALEAVLGRDSAGKVYVLVGREIRESRVPAAQLVLMWVSENVPALAERILAAARAGYAAVPAPDSAPS